MSAWYLVCLLLSAAGVTVTPIQVALVASDGIPDSLVRRICAEVEPIWKSAGISFEWLQPATDDRAGVWGLDVTIDDGELNAAPGCALGWITFTSGAPGRSIHLSRPCAERLLGGRAGGNLTTATHEALVARALGRALAHELGHYLMASRAHTRSGLMRAVHSSDEFFAFSRDGFELTPEQQADAVRHQRIQPAQEWAGE